MCVVGLTLEYIVCGVNLRGAVSWSKLLVGWHTALQEVGWYAPAVNGLARLFWRPVEQGIEAHGTGTLPSTFHNCCMLYGRRGCTRRGV